MPEKYRLFVRPLSDRAYRCLVLRDPTPTNGTVTLMPEPIEQHAEDDAGTPRLRRRWLHGLGTQMRFSDLSLNAITAAQLVRVDDQMDFKVERLPDTAARQRDLFASLGAFPPDAAHDSAEAKLFAQEVQGLVDAFCCTKADRATSGDTVSSRETESALIGVPALIQAYLSDLPLDELARAGLDQNDQPGPLSLAALSGYLFDAGTLPALRPGATVAGLGFTGRDGQITTATLELVKPRAARGPRALPLVLEQEAEGCYLRADWRLVDAAPESHEALSNWRRAGRLAVAAATSGTLTPAELALLNEVSDHTLLIWRSLGAVPVEPGEALARVPTVVLTSQRPVPTPGGNDQPRLHVPEYFYVDHLDPRQWVGELIHYRIELRDILDQVVAAGTISVRRERRDPPPMPKSAAAELDQQGQLSLVVELPREESALEPVVWFQRRPLDACGFYGTDDDLALLEGLRQADLNFEEDADQQEPDRDWEGHPVSRYLRGAYDRYGLEPLGDAPNAALPAPGWTKLTPPQPEGDAANEPPATFLSLTLSPDAVKRLCGDGTSGLRFLVGLRRRTGARPAVQSALRPCQHYLRHEPLDAAGDPIRRPVFQIEWVPPERDRREFLPAERFSLHLLHDGRLDPEPGSLGWVKNPTAAAQNIPFQVQVSLNTNTQPGRVGGYRVYVRDVLGTEDAPFACIRQFEAVSPLIYRYRPYAIDSSRRLRPVAGASAAPTALAEGSKLKEAPAWFEALAQELRTKAGSPRLTRGDGASRLSTEVQPPSGTDGNAPTPAPFRIRPEQLEPLVTELALDGFPTLRAITEALNGPVPSDAEKQRTLEQLRTALNGHWRLLGPLVDWMQANGFARDLILPPGVRTREELRVLLDDCATLKGKSGWAALVVRPESPSPNQRHDLLGTVRLCLLPGKDDVKWTAIEASYTSLLPWALPALANRLVVLTENLGESDLLPWDEAGTCHIVWNGLRDGWHHQIEAVTEVLDRYEMARAFFQAQPRSTPASGPTRPALEQRPLLADPPPRTSDLTEAQLRRLVVPRLHPAPDPPAVVPVLDSTRVAFRLQDSPERLYATHNLLNRVRQGALTTLVQIAYAFPALPAYRKLGFDENWTPPNDGQPLELAGSEGDLLATVSPAGDWTAMLEDEVAIRHALYFLEYTLRARFRADHQESPDAWASARSRRVPGRPRTSGDVEQPGIENTRRVGQATLNRADDGSATLTLPLLRQWDLLSDAERAAALHVYANDATVRHALHWPDLLTAYTLLLRLPLGSAGVFAPLVRVLPPGEEPGEPRFTLVEPHPELLGTTALPDPVLDAARCELRIQLPSPAFLARISDPQLYLAIVRGDLWARPVPIHL